MRAITLGLLLAMVGVVSPAYAQLVEGPPGSSGGIFGGRRPINPNRTSQAFDLNVDLSGGYERDPNALQIDPTTARGWPAGHALVRTNYHVGHLRRSLDARGRGTLRYQGNTHIPLYGGGISLNGLARIGRRSSHTFLATAEASYEPGLALAPSALQPTTVEVPAVELEPALGVVEQRWLMTTSTARYQHSWSRRHHSDIQIGAGRLRPAGNVGLSGGWENGTFSQSWAVDSNFSLRGSYRFDRTLQTEEAIISEPVRYQSATIGAQVAKRFTPTRLLTLSVSGGGTQLMASGSRPDSSSTVHPAISLSAALAASNNWSISISANRQITVLQGISPAPLETDNIAMILNGSVGRRLHIALTASYMDGEAIASSASLSRDHTTARGGSLSVRYGLKRWLGTFATYSYYRHRLETDLQSAGGLPPLYGRYSARAGFTLWVPLYGTF